MAVSSAGVGCTVEEKSRSGGSQWWERDGLSFLLDFFSGFLFFKGNLRMNEGKWRVLRGSLGIFVCALVLICWPFIEVYERLLEGNIVKGICMGE